MIRPTIALACILKNEEHNLPRLLQSVAGCFDEIHLTDTGSTDGSVALIEQYQKGEKLNPAGAPIFLHRFTWCDDFSKARNASFAPVKTDYVMWLDLDDVLSDKDAFKGFRDTVMHLADYWLATYHYGSDKDGKPNCSFARERIVKTSLQIPWQHFVHEGLIPKSPYKQNVEIQYAMTWSVQHKRSNEDLIVDKSRNLSLFEKHKPNLTPRMRYYYGKELFENGKPLEAFQELVSAIAETELEAHDRIMGIQYAGLSAMALNQFDRAISLSHQGIQLAPLRAEFFAMIGDCYVKLGKLKEALPFYRSATECEYTGQLPIQGALFSHEGSYKHYPRNQMARIYANTEQIEKAEAEVEKALALGVDAETIAIHGELISLKERLGFLSKKPRKKTTDIVITGLPIGPYEWDGDVYRTRGVGGSETAAIEMAEWMHKLSGRNVLVFNNRKEKKTVNGVTYSPIIEAQHYFHANEPALHIAWRHNVKLTEAPTYLWCHDLAVPGLFNSKTYEKVLALSPFHKDYLVNFYGIPKDKIFVTRNGISPERFRNLNCENKTPGKVVWSSSPDRGLSNAIRVMDEVIKSVPYATLHVYYGFENMVLAGRNAEVENLKAMISERPYIKLHGNLEQTQLTQELAKACVWLYPTTFLETYCITALEMLACKVFPVVRSYGALPDTLEGQLRTMHESPCETDSEISLYASDVVFALSEKLWEKSLFRMEDHSWQKIARTWLKEFLKEETSAVLSA